MSPREERNQVSIISLVRHAVSPRQVQGIDVKQTCSNADEETFQNGPEFRDVETICCTTQLLETWVNALSKDSSCSQFKMVRGMRQINIRSIH
ncbi:hypothetical protein AVEN_220377-1 [Araneus ventricosus]|uniref:Uncharacterized protein n=1 Tax=Araneus ventricosus TaxID=182803 RepID=A0A4Y1ZMK8_ARAVE|nr:hypothetical protein AVEN_220377-1 [Araneus ventricosus]